MYDCYSEWIAQNNNLVVTYNFHFNVALPLSDISRNHLTAIHSFINSIVTLKIIRVICPLTQVTLTLELKGGSTLTNGIAGTTVATVVLTPNSKDIEMGSCARVNVQFSRLLVDPLESCTLFVWTNVVSDTVSTGGGSCQVILSPPEWK